MMQCFVVGFVLPSLVFLVFLFLLPRRLGPLSPPPPLLRLSWFGFFSSAE